jgi:hypothetical protein
MLLDGPGSVRPGRARLASVPGAGEHDSRRTGATVLRALALLVALGLSVAAVWLIVTGDAKQTKIGVLLGLWGLLLAAHLVTGVRRYQEQMVDVELADLRAEIAALRSQLAEPVGGPLRLERTETARHSDEAHGHAVLARILAREGAAHR